MTTPWKIFACVLAVAVAAAIVMGTTSQSRQGHATLTGANGTAATTDPNTVPFPAAPGDGVLPKGTPPPPPAQSKTPQASTPVTTFSSDASSSSTPAPSSPSASAPAPSGVSSFSSQYSTPSAEPSKDSDTDVSQTPAPETASQRVGKKLRGR